MEVQHSRQQLLVFNSDHLNACKRRELIDCSGFLKVQVEDKGWDERGHSRREAAQQQPPTAGLPQRLPVPTRSGFPLYSCTTSLDPFLLQGAYPCYPALVGVMALNISASQEAGASLPDMVRDSAEAGGILNALQTQTSGCFTTRFQIMAFNSDCRVEMLEAEVWVQAQTICPLKSLFQSLYLQC